MCDTTLVVKHSAGFFSCYTIRLSHIIGYFNDNRKCPEKVDSSQQFMDYKNDRGRDYTYEYIKLNESLMIEYNKAIQITNENREPQFSNYKNINFKDITPFIVKYFSPSDTILKIVSDLESKYMLDYANLAGFYYRGTDKIIETNICDVDSYIEKAIQIKKDNPTIKFLITSDEIHVINLFRTHFPDVIVIEELLHNMGRSFIHSQLFLANVLIMSKAKHLICSSGNVSLWMTLFRGHNNNIHQYLSPKEYIDGIKNNAYDSNNKIFWL